MAKSDNCVAKSFSSEAGVKFPQLVVVCNAISNPSAWYAVACAFVMGVDG